MKTPSNTLLKVYSAAIVVIIPLIAAAWLTPADFPMDFGWRQVAWPIDQTWLHYGYAA